MTSGPRHPHATKQLFLCIHVSPDNLLPVSAYKSIDLDQLNIDSAMPPRATNDGDRCVK
jgi:hypothetical protein